MKFEENSAQAMQWLLASLAVVVATALLVGLHANATTAGLIFLTLVVWSASVSGFWLSLYVALFCAAGFDFFFFTPLHTFQIVGVQQWVALASFLVSSVVVSRVAELARRQTAQAEQRREDVERLYAFGQELMLYEDAERLLRELPRLIVRSFPLEGAALYVCEKEEFYASEQDVPMGLRASIQAMLDGPHPGMDQAGEYTLLPLMLGLRAVGALAWRPASLSREVATAMGAEAAIAVARAMATEATARMEAMREAERLRTALTDSLTHELRTPLTSIRAAATTLLQQGLDEEGRRDLAEIIDEESARLDLLIGEAVELAQIDADSIEVRPMPNLPRALLEQAVEASEKSLARHKVSIDSGEEKQPLWFDAHLLSRVLRHLLENAAAHTPAGTEVHLSSRRSRARLEFLVEDNGPGIDAKDLPQIFERFYRGQRRAGARKGSGMGLAIARAILIAHGGGIEAESALGKGARFRFWVPLVEKEPEPKQ